MRAVVVVVSDVLGQYLLQMSAGVTATLTDAAERISRRR